MMRLLLPLIAASAVWADFSPLDVNSKGIGTVTAPLGARERGMGLSGLATTPQPGVFIANPSRLAFQEKHSFSGTIETSLHYLHDDETGNRRPDAFLPGLTLAFPTRKYGALGLWYWQTSHRNFTLESDESALMQESRRVEGGLFELGFSYSYAPIPQIAFGLDGRKMLGQERFVHRIALNGDTTDSDRLNSRALEDTSRRSLDGWRGGFSVTLRQKKWNAALAVQSGTYLDVKTSRHVTGLISEIRSESEIYLPWSYTLAFALKPKAGQTVTLDLGHSAWDEAQGEGLGPEYTVGTGYEWQGTGGLYDAYWKRCALRVGGGFQALYLYDSWQGYATVGFGFPLGSRGHMLDVSILGGHREVGGNSFVAEEYLKLSVTVQGVGAWGQPLRRRR
jgi:hypothetical protein